MDYVLHQETVIFIIIDDITFPVADALIQSDLQVIRYMSNNDTDKSTRPKVNKGRIKGTIVCLV